MKYFIKRFFDLMISIVVIIFLSPLLLVLLILLKQKMNSAVFKQKRPGLNSKPFIMYKFQTMTNETDNEGNLLPDEERLTKFGSLLRSTSLDELPALFNVLKGDMSLVGPRPLLMQYLDLYTFEQARRHEVKPGITGWAQVNGRNTISWEEKFKLDVWYVDNWTIFLDMKILWFTAIKVLKRADISHSEHATMPEFKGETK